MENNTFLVFLFVISIGVLFIGSGVTGLTSVDVDQLEECRCKEDCGSGAVCCGFQEGDQVYRVCANDCRNIRGFSQGPTVLEEEGFVLEITGKGVQDIRKGSDYWIYILIGVILILLALFYKKSHKKKIVRKKVKKRSKRRSRNR
tara:strand:+ start:467 stop:901 length:435 start_codon:yes stop_codon:yes gene_type:complete